MKTKKILLSSFVILSFIAYTASQRLKSGLFLGWEDDDDDRPVGMSAATSTILDATTTPDPNIPTKPGKYKDGEYTGVTVDVYYGYVQVVAVIQNGNLVNIKFLDYPKDRATSLDIANYSLPILKTEAIAIQSANVDIVSGATQTSEGFKKSLASALLKAI